MYYKYLLGLLEGGLYDEFYREMADGMVCNMQPSAYGRSILQNSSFIVSDVCEDKSLIGRGFQPRLIGANAEILSMLSLMFIGDKGFVCEEGELFFIPRPKLHYRLFDKNRNAELRVSGTRR